MCVYVYTHMKDIAVYSFVIHNLVFIKLVITKRECKVF